jgi:hypothetical protein
MQKESESRMGYSDRWEAVKTTAWVTRVGGLVICVQIVDLVDCGWINGSNQTVLTRLVGPVAQS